MESLANVRMVNGIKEQWRLCRCKSIEPYERDLPVSTYRCSIVYLPSFTSFLRVLSAHIYHVALGLLQNRKFIAVCMVEGPVIMVIVCFVRDAMPIVYLTGWFVYYNGNG